MGILVLKVRELKGVQKRGCDSIERAQEGQDDV
jgi:hypothetical protein